MKKQTEQRIQNEVITWLRLNKWYVFKNIQVGIYKKDTGQYIPAQTKGVSDLTAIKDGVVLFIEVKTKTGRMSENQLKFKADITEHGGYYLTATGYEDVQQYIVDRIID